MSAVVKTWRPVEGLSEDAAKPGFYAECVAPCREVWQRRDTEAAAQADADAHNARLHRGEHGPLDLSWVNRGTS